MSTNIVIENMDRLSSTPWAEQGVSAPQAIIFIEEAGWSSERVWEIVHALNKGINEWNFEPSCRMVHLHPVWTDGVVRKLTEEEFVSLRDQAFRILLSIKDKLGFSPYKDEVKIVLKVQ